MNELKLIELLERDVSRGYGYTQLLSKNNITEEHLYELFKKYPSFKNKLTKRYGIEERTERVEENEEKSIRKGKKKDGWTSQGDTEQEDGHNETNG